MTIIKEDWQMYRVLTAADIVSSSKDSKDSFVGELESVT